MKRSSRWRQRLYFILLPVLIIMVFVHVQIKSDISAFIITGDGLEEALLASEMQSGRLSRRYVLSIGSGDKTPISAMALDALIEPLRQIEGVKAVWRPDQAHSVLHVIKTLYPRYAAQMYSLQPEADLKTLFSRQGLERQARVLKAALLSPQGGVLKEIVLQDPLLLSLRGFKRFFDHTTLPDKTSPYRNLLLETDRPGLDYARQSIIQQRIKEVFAAFRKHDNKPYTLAMTGVPVFAVATQSLIEGDIKTVTVLSSIALLGLFVGLFRSLSALLQVALLLLTVVCAAALITQLVFGFVHGMTLAMGTTLIGVCVDYPIHALVHANGLKGQAVFTRIDRIWPSLLMGGITTLIGYVALGFSGYPGFQQIAVYVGSGILFALCITRYVLPGLIQDMTYRCSNVTLASVWVDFCIRRRRLLMTVLFVAGTCALLVLPSLHWLHDLEQLTPEMAYLKDNDRKIRARMLSSIEPGRFILIRAPTVQSALQKSEQVYQVLQPLRDDGVVDRYFGLYPWLLSERQQRRNFNLLQAQLTEQNRTLWRNALQNEGLSVARLGALQYSGDSILTLEQLLNSPVNRFIDSQIIVQKKQVLLLIWLGKHQPGLVRTALSGLEGVRYFSQRDMLNRMAEDYQKQAVRLLSIGLVLIGLLLLYRYRNLRAVLQTLSPAVLAASFILSGWSLSGQAVSFLHLIGFLLAVAICVDYGIFYRENRAANRHLTYQAMLASMLTSVLVFACLLVAQTAALKTLGGVVAAGVFMGFLFCPVLIRSVPRTGKNSEP